MKYDPISVEYKYKAFISYRHIPRDMAAAKALHTQIERYTVPTGRKDAASRSHKKWKVFRDEEELRITNDLPQSIHDALDASEYLIVVCSPDAVHSKWVPLEIARFLKHHDQQHILTVVTAGDLGQMLPDLLVQVSAEGYDTSRMNEPLYMDIRADNNRLLTALRQLLQTSLEVGIPAGIALHTEPGGLLHQQLGLAGTHMEDAIAAVVGLLLVRLESRTESIILAV